MTERAASVAEDVNALKRVCWDAGDLEYLLHRGNRAREQRMYGPTNRPDLHGQVGARELFYAVRSLALVLAFVLEFGRQTGKTFFSADIGIETLIRAELARTAGLRDKPGRIPYAAPTAKAVEEFFNPTMEIFRAEGQRVGSRFAPEYHRGRWYVGESYILPVGCDDKRKADRLRGPYADGVIVDECGFIPDLRYVIGSVLKYQLATTGGWMLLTSSPPESTEHEFVGYAVRAEAQGAYYRRTVYDAPHQSDEMIAKMCEEAGGAESAEWRREGLAERIPDPKRVIVPEFAPNERRIVVEMARPSHFDTYTVMDTGWSDMTWALFAYYHFERALVVIEDEMSWQHASSATIIPAVKRRELELWAPAELAEMTAAVAKYRAEHPGEDEAEVWAEFLRQSKWRPRWRFVDADPFTRADMAQMHGFHTSDLAKDDLEAAVNKLRVDCGKGGSPSVAIHPRCTGTIAQLRGAIWNRTRTKFASQGDFGHFDGVAAMVYAVRHVDRQRNPFPPVTAGLAYDQRVGSELLAQDERRDRVKKLEKLSAGVVTRLRQRRRGSGA